MLRRVHWGAVILVVTWLLVVVVLFPQASAMPPAQDTQPEIWPDRRAHARFSELQPAPAEGTRERSSDATALAIPAWERLVFQSYRDGNDEIYLDDGSTQVRLTSSPYSDIAPRLDRDCTKVVFASDRSGNYEIYTMNLDGSELTRLTFNYATDTNPAWSPDGTRIVFESHRAGSGDILVMDANGSGQTHLTYGPEWDGEPAWSPDGSQIAFTTYRNSVYHIWRMSADGTDQVQLSTQPGSGHPAWSPTGDKIAFDADGDGDGWQELWTMSSDGSGESQGYNPPEAHTDAWVGSWSPDGSSVAFARVEWIYDGRVWNLDSAYLEAWDWQTGSVVRLSTEGEDLFPDWQTEDLAPPASSMPALPVQSPSPFVVNWSGWDNGPAGLASFDVQVRDGPDGSWTDWLIETVDLSGVYSGAGGHTYYFRCRARDNAGNVEVWAAEPDAFTTVEALAPTTAVQSLAAYSRGEITVRWGGTDRGGSGITGYDVQLRDGPAGSWTGWKIGVTETEAAFSGTAGHTYYFRSRGVDRAGNVESWPPGDGDASTTLYVWKITGRLRDNRETPVMGGEVSLVPEALVVIPSGVDGAYAGYEATGSSVYAAAWSKAGYGDVPETRFGSGSDGLADVVLPPSGNLVLNWGFEDGSLEPGWSAGGDLLPSITQALPHSGLQAVALGGPQGMSEPGTNVSNRVYDSRLPLIGVDSRGAVHLVWWEDMRPGWDITYARRKPDGAWSSPLHLYHMNQMTWGLCMVVQPDGTVHVAWAVEDTINDILYARRAPDGTWFDPVNISNTPGMSRDPDMVAGSDGAVHVVWQESDRDIYYSRRSPQGSWSAAIKLVQSGRQAGSPQVEVGPEDTVHAVWQQDDDDNLEIMYAWRSGAGDWSAPLNISNLPGESAGPQLKVGDDGTVHVVWRDSSVHFRNVLYAQGGGGRPWSVPHHVSWSTKDYGEQTRLGLGPDGSVHVVWDGVWYSHRDADGVWSGRLQVAQGEVPELEVDPAGRAHITYYAWPGGGQEAEIFYAWRSGDGTWWGEYNISNTISPSTRPRLALLGTRPHVVWEEDVHPGDQWEVLYSSPGISTVDADAILSQTLTLDSAMQAPTLSFWYRLEGSPAPGGSWLGVGVQEGGGVTDLYTATETCDWTHGWLDLSPWAGQQIALQLSVHQTEGQRLAWATVDEVSAGPADPDLWASKTSLKAIVPPVEPIEFTITYGNRGGAGARQVVLTETLPAELQFVSADPPPSSVLPFLTWEVGDLPPRSGPFTIRLVAVPAPGVPDRITVTNAVDMGSAGGELETSNNQAQASVWIGWRVVLPLVVRQY